MRRALSLSEFAARLHVSARAIWQLFLVFPRFLSGDYEHGPFLLLNPGTQDRVVAILDLKRKGWSEDEIRAWLERHGAENADSAAAVSTNESVASRPNSSNNSMMVPGERPTDPRAKPAVPVVEEEILLWKRIVDVAIQPFLGRIDALAREVRSVRNTPPSRD